MINIGTLLINIGTFLINIGTLKPFSNVYADEVG